MYMCKYYVCTVVYIGVSTATILRYDLFVTLYHDSTNLVYINISISIVGVVMFRMK